MNMIGIWRCISDTPIWKRLNMNVELVINWNLTG